MCVSTQHGDAHTLMLVSDFYVITDWELDFIDRMETLSAVSSTTFNVAMHYLAARSMDDELARSSMADTFTFVVSYTLMSAFTGFCISRNYNRVESRVGLSLCGISCIILGMFVCCEDIFFALLCQHYIVLISLICQLIDG